MLIRQHTLERNLLVARSRIRIWQYVRSRRNDLVVLLCSYGKYAPEVVGRTLPREEQRIARKLTAPRKHDWLMGRWLAHQALHLHSAGYPCHGWIARNEHGAPVLRIARGDRRWLSIAHIDRWVGAVVHRTRRVGLDIEADAVFPTGATRYFLNSAEVVELANTTNFPMNAWVAKEAAYKALHCKEVSHLKDLQIWTHCAEELGIDQWRHFSFIVSRRSDGKTSNVEYRRLKKLKINFGLATL
jgi:4'-phosphopantetheinyl transferase EntD